MFISIHALSMEELSSGMKWPIFRQRCQHVKYLGSSSKPISLDLAHFCIQILSTSIWHISKVYFICAIYKRSTRWEKYFASKQEATTKDVERCFGCSKQDGLSYNNQVICDTKNAVIACCIMHNMIHEYKSDHILYSILEPMHVENTV